MPLIKGGDLVMALKESDLFGSLWKGADELRCGMDASQYKDCVLTLLFVKYVTDKAKPNKNSLIDVPIGGSFDDLITFKGDKEIGDKRNKAISKLAEANDLQKVIDLADFNDEGKLGKGKKMQDRLTNLISIFKDLDFRGSRSVLADYLALSEEEATANTKLKAAQENLMEKKYSSNMPISPRTTSRRWWWTTNGWTSPLPQLTDEVASLASRVEEHLKRMGFK